MELGIIYSGKFGERFLCNLAFPKLCPHFGACGIDFCDFCKEYDFSSNIVFLKKLQEPYQIGLYVENPTEFVDKFSCELLIAINVHPDILISLPKIGEFRAIIIPACDQKWCQPGLRMQLSRICSEIGIEFHSPKPFCSFLPDSNFSLKFCRTFKIGRPVFKAKLEDNRISDLGVLISDPCGSAYYVAKKMKGFIIESREDLYKEIHQHQCAYPCMASMERDPELKEAPFHLAGYIMIYDFCKALGIDSTDFIPEYFQEIVRKSWTDKIL